MHPEFRPVSFQSGHSSIIFIVCSEMGDVTHLVTTSCLNSHINKLPYRKELLWKESICGLQASHVTNIWFCTSLEPVSYTHTYTCNSSLIFLLVQTLGPGSNSGSIIKMCLVCDWTDYSSKRTPEWPKAFRYIPNRQGTSVVGLFDWWAMFRIGWDDCWTSQEYQIFDNYDLHQVLPHSLPLAG